MLAAQLRPLGLTPSQAEVIRVVADRGELTIGELGELLVCESGTNPSRLVDRLVEAGMLQRREGVDKRRVILSLTSAGRGAEQAVRRIEERMYASIDAAGEGLDADAVVAYLTRLSAGSPSGLAVARREA